MNFPRRRETWRISWVDNGSSEEGEMGMLRCGEEESRSDIDAARWIARFIASKRTAFWAFDCWMFFGVGLVRGGRGGGVGVVDWICIIVLRI